MGQLEYLFAQRSDAANNLSVPETVSCWICLEGKDDTENGPLLRGCACRGDAGYCHVECLASFADRKEDELWDRGDSTHYPPWTTCGMCMQPFSGKLNTDLALIHYARHKKLNPKMDATQFGKLRIALDHIGGMYMDENQPGKALQYIQRKYDIDMSNIEIRGDLIHFKWFDNEEFSDTCNLLGGCHLRMGNLDDAMFIFKQGLEFLKKQNLGGERNNTNPKGYSESYLLNSIAEVHAKRLEFAEAVKLRRKMLRLREKADGKDSYGYIEGAFSLGCVLISDGKFDEGLDLIKESKERAQRVLGPLHHHVMKCDAFLTNVVVGDRLSDQSQGHQGYFNPNMARVCGLKSRADLNGQRVEVRSYNQDTRRYKAIIWEAGQEKEHIAIKPNNLILNERVKVVLRGLVSANDLNGKRGEVISFHDDLERYSIRLCDGSKKEIGVKPENAIAY